MVSYNTNELFSATEVAKNFATITSKLYKNELEKVGILKNNKLDFILLKSEDFEKMIQKEVQKALFEEDRKFVATQVEKIKSGTAKFYSIEETEAKLNAAIKAYEH
jgi:PHD/YefM family antitoxin component YafN of YafNO toxin-antitoxin module